MRIGEAAAILVGFICCHWMWSPAKPMRVDRSPGHAATLIAELDAARPKVVLAGSPQQLDALPPSFLGETDAHALTSARLASAWWYLILKNALPKMDAPPETFVIVYAGVDPTLPGKRVFAPADRRALDALATDRERLLDRLAYHERMDSVEFALSEWTGLYQSRMQVRERLEGVVAGGVARVVGTTPDTLEEARRDRFSRPHWDPALRERHQEERTAARTEFDNRYFEFAAELRTSFLPAMVDLARRHGIRLVFAETEPPLRYTQEQEKLAARYRAAFRAWLAWHGGIHIDLRGLPPDAWPDTLRPHLHAAPTSE